MQIRFKYLLPVVFFFLILISLVIFLMTRQRNCYKEHSENVLNGVVVEIDQAGKGAVRYRIKEGDIIEEITFSGKKEINIGDSVSKKSGESYFVFRKNEKGTYDLFNQFAY